MAAYPKRVRPRKGQGSAQLSREEIVRRWRERFYDPAFAKRENAFEQLAQVAWDAYDDYRKSPQRVSPRAPTNEIQGKEARPK